MSTKNMICFDRLTKYSYRLFDYKLQEGAKLKLLNTTIIQGEYGINIDQTDHIIKNIIQAFWLTKTKEDINFQKSMLRQILSENKK